MLQEIGDDQEQAASTLGAGPLADLLAGHAAVDPLGRDLRGRSSPRRGRWASSARSRWSRAGSPARPRPCRSTCGELFDTFNVAGAYAAAVVLALLALVVLFAMNFIQRRDRAILAGPSVATEPGALVPHLDVTDDKENR